ncbi:axoneme-associated protein mst101(2)-like [Camellia sinensis]|uniref:axoneme-associated protein mst101(2)-like n=1 Tax=Camellia sinensis TaxID=4442 RepID=UPI00103680F2|nr:axoneme-associated protein mst101(2)-like [Camellia sinensis]
MGRKKAIADDLPADIPTTITAQPSPFQSQPKPKRLKKAQPKEMAIQYSHSFAMQAFAIKKELANKTREAAGLQKTINKAEAKMKTLTDQAEAAKKAQDEAKEKADTAEAIAKVLAAEKKEAEAKMIEAQKKLQDALAIKEAEIKAADEKAYTEGVADVKEDYKKQDEEDKVSKGASSHKTTSEVPITEKSIDLTLQEIYTKLEAEKAAEKSSQLSSGTETQPTE